MSKHRRRKISAAKLVMAVLALGLSLLVWRSYSPAPAPVTPLAPAGGERGFEKSIPVTVLEVLDGDTVVVTGELHVRLIGVDAFETRRDKRLEGQAGALGMNLDTAEKWARRAKEFAQRELLDKSVELRPGYEKYDRYQRLLAYVWYRPERSTEPVCFNKRLIENGYAVAYNRFKHPALEEFIAGGKEAKRLRKGLWAER